MADAPAKRAVGMECDERPTSHGERADEGWVRKRAPLDVSRDRIASEPQEHNAVGFAGHRDVKLPSAAARYPTTDDVSPDTSPESA